MIVLLMGGEGLAAIGDQVIMPVHLILGKYHSQSLLRSICSK